MKISIETYDELSPDERESAPQNGCGKEYANYLRIRHDGETILIESDAMESEDATFTRDLSWIVEAFKHIYSLGYEKGFENGQNNILESMNR
jgi:hypothetical protein